ncbi:hypothetical protein [Thermococcus sp.]
METVKIEIPRELEKEVKRYIRALQKKKKIIKETFGILKTEKSAVELKVELYDKLYD